MIQPTGVIASLRTARFSELLAFYTRLLGPPEKTVSGKWARFKLPGCALVLWRQANMKPLDGGIQLCLTVADLDQTCRLLNHQTDISEASHGREAFLRDPDGNTLILYQPHVVD